MDRTQGPLFELTTELWTTNNPHNPLYILHRWYWMPQSHIWQTADRTPLGVDWKILSTRRSAMLSFNCLITCVQSFRVREGGKLVVTGQTQSHWLELSAVWSLNYEHKATSSLVFTIFSYCTDCAECIRGSLASRILSTTMLNSLNA